MPRTHLRRLGMSRWHFFAAPLLGLANVAGAQPLANSQTGHSGVQGQGGWYYGFYEGTLNPSGFQQFPLYGVFLPNAWSRTCNCPGGYWTFLSDIGGHTSGTFGVNGRQAVVNWAVRRLVLAEGGSITISGTLRKVVETCGNGVRGHIFVNGAEVWSQPIAGNNTTGITYSLEFCAPAGTVIDWALDPVSGNEHCDYSVFSASVRGPITQQPAADAACLGGTAEFSVAATGTGPFTYRWQWQPAGDGTPWVDLNEGINSHDGAAMLEATDVTSTTMRGRPLFAIVNLDPRRVRCAVTDPCAVTLSASAQLFVDPADVGRQGGEAGRDGLYDNNDFIVFINLFFNESLAADLGSAGGVLGSDSAFDNNDFIAFIEQFFNPC